jgi:hypothetical protein
MARQGDLYEILQVSPRAEPEVIEAAFRRLARMYHPDVHPSGGDPGRMVAFNLAYETLKDPAKRAAYDRRRATTESSGPAAPRRPVVRAWWEESSAVRPNPPPIDTTSTRVPSGGGVTAFAENVIEGTVGAVADGLFWSFAGLLVLVMLAWVALVFFLGVDSAVRLFSSFLSLLTTT